MLINVIGIYFVSQLLELMVIICCDLGLQDVQIVIVYCGVCYFDFYQV